PHPLLLFLHHSLPPLLPPSFPTRRSSDLGTPDAPRDARRRTAYGTLDTLVAPDGGARTAELIPGAELLTIEGMGHDLPVEAWQQIISAITAMAARSA